MEKVSVITPAYNCGRYIAEAIEAVLAQTYTNWEMIIVDDCSGDDTYDIASKYAARDQRVTCHRLSRNAGAAVSRTKAMELAEGDYIAFLDSDDVWEPEKLERQLKFMADNGYNMTATAYRQISEDGLRAYKVMRPPLKTDYNRILLDCPVGNSTVMYNVNTMGKFTVPDIRKRNDDALWLKMLKAGEYIYGMDDVLTRYRIRKNSVSSNKLSLVKYHWILCRQIEGLPISKVLYLLCHWGMLKLFHIK